MIRVVVVVEKKGHHRHKYDKTKKRRETRLNIKWPALVFVVVDIIIDNNQLTLFRRNIIATIQYIGI